MEEPIEEVYFRWLYSLVASVDVPTPSLNYWRLMSALHNTEFVWVVVGDHNRAEDGVDIRMDFLRTSNVDVDPEWFDLPCSLLEMLIGFSRKVEFETDTPARDWFWIFLSNLGIAKFSDSALNTEATTQMVIDRLIWRTYRSDGQGGLFPLGRSRKDQRKVEIWYQFCDYLVDQDLL